MDAKTILELAMIKCSVRYNPKDINAWVDSKTHGQLAKDLADQLSVMGYCLQKNNFSEDTNTEMEPELTTNDGE